MVIPPAVSRVASHYAVEIGDMLRHTKERRAALARHVAMHALHCEAGWTILDVAILFDRDESTVRYGVARVETMRRDDAMLDGFLCEIGDEQRVLREAA